MIHLLLTDIIMPMMDGRVLADQLRAIRPEMRVLYVSGYSEKQLGRSRPLDLDLAYLLKPFPPEALAAKCAKFWTQGRRRGGHRLREDRNSVGEDAGQVSIFVSGGGREMKGCGRLAKSGDWRRRAPLKNAAAPQPGRRL